MPAAQLYETCMVTLVCPRDTGFSVNQWSSLHPERGGSGRNWAATRDPGWSTSDRRHTRLAACSHSPLPDRQSECRLSRRLTRRTVHCHPCTGSRCRCPGQVLCSRHCTLAASSAPARICQSTSPPSAHWHHRTSSRCHCPGPLNTTAVPWPTLTAAPSARGSTSLLSVRLRHRTTLTCYHQIIAAMNPND